MGVLIPKGSGPEWIVSDIFVCSLGSYIRKDGLPLTSSVVASAKLERTRRRWPLRRCKSSIARWWREILGDQTQL